MPSETPITENRIFSKGRRIKYGDMCVLWEVVTVRESGVELSLWNNTVSPHKHYMSWEELESAGVEFVV